MTAYEKPISVWISILYRYRRSYIVKKLEKYGSLGGWYLLVMSLYHNEGASQEQLAGILKIDKAAVARGVKKLVKDEYVIRRPDSADKRAYQLFLTQKALDLIPEILGVMKEWEKGILSGIPEESHGMIKQYLRQMAENACGVKPEAL
ncbi:MarR family winged helix-turn-helix transcriptional regulator [Papillibacter cinnamivorans]|uniref:DNA-binding transcriptional regulator, MarR family n=1 Tax=Papillibacter cinnamivorans DSM 12816 TaxID=1122930 RepID=A0A1W2CRY4_9FIRM|nr:MarR family transcriptional regulator [Papillibacter cinnamivorans]SMC87714.1 DNA-binding transcriptional regulator, MarR family [Papillibacter cinnamivorans DSM 12816]